jgi:uncharacterized membrane protein
MRPRATGFGLTEEEFEKLLGHVLRAGVAISAALVAAGGAWYLIDHPEVPPDYHVFQGEPSRAWSLAVILADLRMPGGRGLIQLGVLVLIATPMARVVFSAFGFGTRGDWLYVGVSLIVLLLLALSLTSG